MKARQALGCINCIGNFGITKLFLYIHVQVDIVYRDVHNHSGS